MIYYLYEIKNNINGKLYIGVHKTIDINDGYMGSGKVIKQAIQKYGIHNFTKKIIEVFDAAEEMFAKEKEIVTEEFLSRKDVYNLRRGGTGGWDFINKNTKLRIVKNKKARKKTNIVLKNKYGKEWKSVIGKLAAVGASSEKAKQKRKQTRINNGTKSSTFYMNTKKAVENRKKTFAIIEHQCGHKNSQYGTMWITNGVENKKVDKDFVLPTGWRNGRALSKK